MSSQPQRSDVPQSALPLAFAVGAKVCLKSNVRQQGIVIGQPIQSNGKWQYQVFFSVDNQVYVNETDLRPVAPLDQDSAGQVRFGSLADLLRHLALAKLRNPQTDALYSLYASRTQFEVYQFKPALKFLRNPDQRLLIADEVGLGKTIEAGIIFLELQARLDVARVLVVCPSGLRAKWRDEMRSRFDETFTILDRGSFLGFVKNFKRYGPAERLKGIISLEAARREDVVKMLKDVQARFDLIIVDEAHHCRNTTTLSNKVATLLSSLADAMLLLTATPINLGDENLYELLRILSPDEFDDYDAFRHRLEPNRFVNKAVRLLAAGRTAEALAELQKVEATSESNRFLENPYYREVQRLLSQAQLSREDQIVAQRRILGLNTLDNIFTRTRKREVQHQNVARRKAHTIKIHFTPREQRFYDKAIEYARSKYMALTGTSWAPAWAVMMRARQAASCISAMRERLEQEMKEQLPASAEDEDVAQELLAEEEVPDESQAFLPIPDRALLTAAQAAEGTDTKFNEFLKAVRSVMDEDARIAKPSKILVFSFFKGTLAYLHRQLRKAGIRAEMIHGDIDVIVRQKIVEDFRDDPKITVLLSSEVGAEGLDFQFCDVLFNYDLPWNPMKVEQRIGRLDRFGQLAPIIRIYNLVIENSIEERVFLRLFERIRVFEEAIGDLEAILGEEIRSLSNNIFQARLTPRDEQEMVEKAAETIERRRQELEDFDKQRLEFMGQDAILGAQVEQTIESGRFVSEKEVGALVTTFVRRRFPRTQIEDNHDNGATFVLKPDNDFIQHMQVFSSSLAKDQTANEFLRKLYESEIIRLTFSANIAYERKQLEFVTPRHPVARAAMEYWKGEISPELPMSSIVVQADSALQGDYFFFVHMFDTRGVESNATLAACAISMALLQVDVKLSEQFLRLVQQAHPAPREMGLCLNPERQGLFRNAKSIADNVAAAEHDRREQEIRRTNQAIVNARLAALEQTYKTKRKRVLKQAKTATEPRIQRMYEGQLRNDEAKYKAKKQKIEAQQEIVVQHCLVLAGLARVIPT